LKKINDRIDDKLARRRQQQTTKPDRVQSTPPPPTTTSNPLPHTTISNPFTPTTTTDAPLFNNEEYSIFRDIPASRPTRTTVCLLIIIIL
jgi:hypothetical protein